jgi:hypothetical protein
MRYTFRALSLSLTFSSTLSVDILQAIDSFVMRAFSNTEALSLRELDVALLLHVRGCLYSLDVCGGRLYFTPARCVGVGMGVTIEGLDCDGAECPIPKPVCGYVSLLSSVLHLIRSSC